MSAEILREAAALMRERAEAATAGRWEPMAGAFGNPSDGPDHMRVVTEGWSDAYDVEHTVARTEYDQQGGNDAEHIASWHPTVALLVADLLNNIIGAQEQDVSAIELDALAVARAYLGSDQ